MLHVHYSDSLDALLQRLAASVAAQPFSLVQPTTILVPNANVAKWLKMQFAQINGVAMNVDFPYLEQGLWDLTSEVTGTDPNLAQPTSAEQSRFAVAARLVVALENNESANPLVGFCLNGQPNFSRHNPDQVRRVWQLSTDLSRLFREYEYHRGLSPLDSRPPPRPGMLHERDLVGFWLNPENDLADVPESLLPQSIRAARRNRLCALFAAQGNLYRDAVEALRCGSPPEISLPSLARQTNWGAIPHPETQRTIHLFGISQLSPFHCWLLHHLGRHADLHLYHFNICREFWEDVETPGELRRSLQRTGIVEDELDLRIENELLSAWGKSGRETIRLLGGIEELGEAAFEWLPNPTPPSATMLSQVQHAIATRTSDLTPLPTADASLEWLACPSVRREVETVHNHIISALTEDSSLKQTDIAVLVPHMQTYRTAFGATFDARGTLDYNLVDSTAGSDSILAKGILNALALVGSPFTRKEVVELLANPCVLRAMRASEDDLETWISWTEALGIFHHFDADHRTCDQLTDTTHHTWKQGLQRLRLGRILNAADEHTPFSEHPPYADMHTSGQCLDRLSLWLTRLHKRTEALQISQTPEAWATTLNQFIDDFFVIPLERPQEEQVLSSIHAALRTLAGGSGTIGFGGHLNAAGSPDPALPLEWVRQYLSDSISTIPSGRGAYLTGGITIASLLPMRPVPFRRIYILGLGEGEFPGKDSSPALDLRSYRRRIGDTTHSDTGRYLFLETLMATSERLCLSYVARDIKKDEEKQPCSVLLQLQSCIDMHLLQDAGSWNPQKPLLNSYSPAYITAPPDETTPLTPQWGLASQLLAYAAHPQADPDALTPLQARFPMVAAASRAIAQPPTQEPPPLQLTEQPTRITLRELATFLKDPADAVLRYHYRIYDLPDEACATAEDEPLESGFPASYTIPRDALRAAFLEGDVAAGESYIAQAVATRAHASLGPADDFQPFDEDALAGPLHDRVGKRGSAFTAFAALGAQIREPDTGVRDLELSTEQLKQAITIGYEPATLEVTYAHAPDTVAALALIPAKRKKGLGLPAKLIAEWLELLHRVAQLTEAPERQRDLILYASFSSPQNPVQFRDAISPLGARKRLALLANDYLTTSTIELLPYETIRTNCIGPNGQLKPNTTSETIATAIDDAQGPFGNYRPKAIVRLNSDRLDIPPDILTRIPERLGWLLSLTEQKLAAPDPEQEVTHG